MSALVMTSFPALKGHCYLGQGKNKTGKKKKKKIKCSTS